ncbi:glycosyltransferase family 1 protein [soil metagenome]
MKIAILGTKGIPNNYGGYEQFAEYISARLIERGHSVTVYNPSFHPFKGNSLNGVQIITKFSPEKWIGGAANFIYDFLCLQDALKRDFDVIYEAGYHSVALSFKLLGVKKRKHPVIITNMDGLEYERSKWSSFTQGLIRKLEKIAVRETHYMISDNLGIKEYYLSNFGKDSFFIPYGADPVESFNPDFLVSHAVKSFNYSMLVARLEPENNIETILDGFRQSTDKGVFLVVGNHKTSYGEYLKKKYRDNSILFVGGIYNKKELDSLRHFSRAYFHGHSVGGTNPSLLEAMACQPFIIAHDNVFNRKVLYESAFYFKNSQEVKELMNKISTLRDTHLTEFKKTNLERVKTQYNWETIVSQHEDLFRKLSGKT